MFVRLCRDGREVVKCLLLGELSDLKNARIQSFSHLLLANLCTKNHDLIDQNRVGVPVQGVETPLLEWRGLLKRMAP